MRVVLLICAVLASFVGVRPSDAQTARDYWILGTINNASGSPASVTMVDVARITTTGGVRSAYVETFYSPEQRNGLRRLSAITELDCSGRRLRTLTINAFYSGSSSPSTVPGDGNWGAIRPNTAGEATWNFVCSSNQQRAANPVLFHLGNNEPQGAADLLFGR